MYPEGARAPTKVVDREQGRSAARLHGSNNTRVSSARNVQALVGDGDGTSGRKKHLRGALHVTVLRKRGGRAAAVGQR